MLKGKRLYDAARSFVEDEVVPSLDVDLSDEKEEALLADGVLLGTALLIDVAESLHKIATKVG